MFICLFLFICLSANLPVYLLVYLPINLSFHLLLYLSVSLPVFLSVYLSTCKPPCPLVFILAACMRSFLCCNVLKGLWRRCCDRGKCDRARGTTPPPLPSPLLTTAHSYETCTLKPIPDSGSSRGINLPYETVDILQLESEKHPIAKRYCGALVLMVPALCLCRSVELLWSI
jgi:hypothetical protein